MEDFEKLGVFYLGRVFDIEGKKTKDELLLYDSKDLVTHAVCVGMTGSGKTGLCLSLIEEAAIDGVPAILIDPKGDLANLLLSFPMLGGQDFLPWINLDDARQRGMSPVDYANKQADNWKKGLADWGQDGTRIQRLRDAADFMIYTPGSNAGFPISILHSFAMPESAILADSDLLRERISTTVSSLLGLIGIEADPIQSREHILLSTIMDSAWAQGMNLDIASLIQHVQTPPISKIGVLDLESFYPSKERFNLVMALNSLLASPGFKPWMQGIPLDIGQILYTPGGKPRIAIFSIAHLSDPERMFFVSLLMNQVQGWMRAQSGTTSLRAIVYMDEIFGYLPPVANPPSKLPMLSMLKQARAFGVAMVLATQNPVDLDYKALANAGTWFIGRLQTERDKARLLDGLESVTASTGAQFNRKQIEKIISSLGNRVFLMNNVHEDAPEIFQTRWALCYLRGPLTKDQIKILMDPLKSSTIVSGADTQLRITPPITDAGIQLSQQPALPPGVPCFFIPTRGTTSTINKLMYQPRILGAAKVNFSDTKRQLALSQNVVFLTPITENAIPVVWDNAEEINIPAADLEKSPQGGALFSELPASAGQSKNYPTWNRDFSSWLYGTQKIDLFMSPSLKEASQPNESERDFRIRLQQTSREQRDELVEQLRKKYTSKNAILQERLRKAQQAVAEQSDQAKQAKYQTAISIGATLFGAITGRRSILSRASTAARGFTRAYDEGRDVSRAGETVEAIQQQLADLDTAFQSEITNLQEKLDPQTEVLETLSIKPKKTDIIVQLVALVWIPYWQDPQGKLATAW
jgi:hypothetical protein